MHVEDKARGEEYWDECLKSICAENEELNRTDWNEVASNPKHYYAIRHKDGEIDPSGKDDVALADEIRNVMEKLFEIVEPKLRSYEMNKEIAEEAQKQCDEIKALLEASPQVVLTGAPGTGKTYSAREIARALVLGDEVLSVREEQLDEGQKKELAARRKIVQFHPGYDYSDFVIGLKPVLGKDRTSVSYDWTSGVFKTFAETAKNAYDNARSKGETPPKYVMIIDEINRADLSRVFGELFSLIEIDYRYRKDDENKVVNGEGIVLPNGDTFVIPENLYIIGTMNDIDRSVDSMDFALRRRFAWYEVTAKSSTRIINAKVTDPLASKLVAAMNELNGYISGRVSLSIDGGRLAALGLGPEYELGGAIFAKYDGGSIESYWKNHIAVILAEYLRGNRDKEKILEALKGVFNRDMDS